MVTVHKLGGGVLRNADDYARAASVLKPLGPGQVVVVSALYGVTDQLQAASQRLKDNHVDEFCQNLLQQHLHLVEPIPNENLQKRTSRLLMDKMTKLSRVLYGVQLLEELSPKTLDLIMSFGERLSALVMEGHLQRSGIDSVAWMADDAGLITTDTFGNAMPLWELCSENLAKTVGPDAEKGAAVFTGYFGKSLKGHVATLGRGGSDFSAGIVAHALNAKNVWIWKDVPGFMTADPQMVPDARFIPHLSYSEAEELGYFGAKILHPKTIAPLREKRIPVQIKSIMEPEKTGTLISAHCKTVDGIAKSVAFKKDCVLVTIKGASLTNVASYAYPLFDQLKEDDLPIDTITTSQSDLSLCFEQKYRSRFQEALFATDIPATSITFEDDSALIGVIGEGMRNSIGTSSRLFNALENAGVNVRVIAQGASEINITVGMAASDVDKALKAVHAEFIEEK